MFNILTLAIISLIILSGANALAEEKDCNLLDDTSVAKESYSAYEKNKDSIQSILYEQIKSGHSALYDNSFDIVTHQYSQRDLDAIIPILREELSLAGYEKPDNKEFGEKIKSIFGRIIDFNKESKYLYVNYEDKKDRKFKFYRNDDSIEIRPYSIFIVKKYNFITELYAIPEILNYKQKFPQIAFFEKNMKTVINDDEGAGIKTNKWGDEENLNIKFNLEKLIHRNKYLFKDNKESLDWLIKNDHKFISTFINHHKRKSLGK